MQLNYIKQIMKIKIRIDFLFGFLIWVCVQINCGYPAYEEYLHDFGKNYLSQEQLGKRRQIYQARISLFNKITEYTPGVNNLTDWTDEEINRLKNTKLQIPQQITQNTEEQISSLRVSASTYPESLDWRERKAVTSVKNQGTCGSCWAFAATAYVESKLIIERNYPISVDLSEQYLLSCTKGSNCDGGFIADALQLVAKGGIPYEASFPYNPFGKVSSQICNTQNKVTQAGKSYRMIKNVSEQTLIRLLQQGPVATEISAENWEYYGRGIFICPQNTNVSHVVLVVGYTNTAWIIKNQWGKSWGESGYMRITRATNFPGLNCLIGSNIVYLDPFIADSDLSESILKHKFILLFIVLLILMI